MKTKFLKMKYILLIVLIITSLINFYIGHSLNWYKGYLSNYLDLVISYPKYIVEGEWLYKTKDIELDIIIDENKIYVETSHYVVNGYYKNNLKNINYTYCDVMFNYWSVMSGKIFVNINQSKSEEKSLLDGGDDNIFWGDFKYKLNGDLVLFNINDDNNLWGGEDEIILKRIS